MKKIISFIFSIARIDNFRRISTFQIISQSIAGVLSFSLTIFGTYYFIHSIVKYCFPACQENPEFYSLIKDLLASFELFFMAPIPFLIIFSHKHNIDVVFYDIIPNQRKVFLDETSAKKGFISSIIGIISTFTLGVFFEFFSKENNKRNELFENHFWYCFIMICMLFIFLTILIFYYKHLSNHEDKNG